MIVIYMKGRSYTGWYLELCMLRAPVLRDDLETAHSSKPV